MQAKEDVAKRHGISHQHHQEYKVDKEFGDNQSLFL